MNEFYSGAKSTEVKPRYDLVPLEAITMIAHRLGYGASRHGERNYEKGLHDVTFIRDRQNHAVEHMLLYINKTTTTEEDGTVTTPLQHLEAAITNLAMLCYLELNK